MLCKCYWIVLYIVHVTAFCLEGPFFSGHGVFCFCLISLLFCLLVRFFIINFVVFVAFVDCFWLILIVFDILGIFHLIFIPCLF